MTHASLFSGIGGFDLAAQWAGWTNVFNCEIDTFCQHILKYYFPNAQQYSDIKATDFSVWRDRIDVLSGGFPCQPFSQAGKRKGTDDDRYLWPEMLRAIREINPRWIVGENVLGIVNWNRGMVFEQVCSDLETEGYKVQPFVLPACGVNAPHRRDRVWFVAYADGGAGLRESGAVAGEGREERLSERDEVREPVESGGIWGRATENTLRVRFPPAQSEEEPHAGRFGQSGAGDNVWIRGAEGTTSDRADAGAEGVQQRGQDGVSGFEVAADTNCVERSEKAERHISAWNDWPGWQDFPTQSPIYCGNDGFPARLDGITLPRWRKESIKAYGNAVVPQLVFQIFQVINNYENRNQPNH